MNKFIFILFFLIAQLSFGQECMNVKFKIRGYFYAGSSQIDSTALGGFYVDKNVPKKLNDEIGKYSNSKDLKLVVKPEMTAEYMEGIAGFKVFVINKSDSIMELPAQDSRLYLIRQVFYQNEWRDVEYLPSSWCGNSYHNVYINPNEYWEFTAPCLRGKIEAKFRFQLYVNENLTIYSNEFDGSFNKRQLKKEQGYKPMGFMDPYNN